MTTTKIKFHTNSHLRIETDYETNKLISDFFTFYSPGYKYSPKYKAGIWDGKIHLYHLGTKLLPVGLLSMLIKFLSKNGITFTTDKELNPFSGLDLSQLDMYIKGLNLYSRGEPIELHTHQLDGITQALKKKKSLLLSPTSSGKSLILYVFIRYQIEVLGNNVVLMVPTTQLVEQMYSDFKEYSEGNGWDVEANTTKIYSGQERRLDKPLIISTWQSVYSIGKRNKRLYDTLVSQTDVLCCDEAHQYKAKEILDLCAGFKESEWKLGVTGTIDDSKINVLQLTGLFSEPYKVITTKELMDIGLVSDLDINVLVLEYPNYVKDSLVRGFKWDDEINFLVTNQTRNRFIANLATRLKGVTLILFTFIGKHGDQLNDMLQEMNSTTGTTVKYINGGTEVEDREAVRKLAASGENMIILASSSLFSTGTNIPTITNIIFAMPSKSSIRIRQSIGRGLRLHKSKNVCTIYDIADDLRSDRYMNRTYSHMLERLDIYRKDEFDFKMKSIKLEYDERTDNPF